MRVKPESTFFLYAINGLHDVYLFSNTYYVKMVKFIQRIRI